MIKIARFFILVFLLSNLIYIYKVNAAAVNCRSCSQEDVQMAINIAADADVVIIPAGNCIWTSSVNVPNNKGLTIQGAGTYMTAIADKTPIGWPHWAFGVTLAKNNSQFRLTGLTFYGSRSNPTGSTFNRSSDLEGIVRLRGESNNFRIDHVSFEYIGGRAIYIDPTEGDIFGLIDHCIFLGDVNSGIRVCGYSNKYDNFPQFPYHLTYPHPLIGSMDCMVEGCPVDFNANANLTADAVYVEDCLFRFDDSDNSQQAIDSVNGGRYIFRHNRLENAFVGPHWFDSTCSYD